jgi:hypothetical protein
MRNHGKARIVVARRIPVETLGDIPTADEVGQLHIVLFVPARVAMPPARTTAPARSEQ